MIFSTLALFSSAVIAAPLSQNEIDAMEKNVQKLRSDKEELYCFPYEEKLFDCVNNLSMSEYSSLEHAVANCKQTVERSAMDSKDWNKRPNIIDICENISNTSLTWARSRGILGLRGSLKRWRKAIRDLKCEHEFYKVNVPMNEKILSCVKNFRVEDYTTLSSAKSTCAKKHGLDLMKVDQKYKGCPAKKPKQSSQSGKAPSQKRN